MPMLGYVLIAVVVVLALAHLRRIEWRQGSPTVRLATVVLLLALLAFVVWLITVLLMGTAGRTWQ